ncbi:hypothetical protein MASR1M60_13360 [Rhodocyclaceae bacterium]
MTRAKENLILCEGSQHPNPFSPALKGEAISRSPFPVTIDRRPELSLRYVSIALKGVFLDFAGYKQKNDPVYRELAKLTVGDLLFITQQGDRREISTSSGVIVGRLAKNGHIPEGKIVRATVESLVWRSSTMISDPEFRGRLKSESWWVVLPALVIQGNDVSAVDGWCG